MNQSIWLHRCPGGKRFDALRPNSLTMFANLVHCWQRLYLQLQSSRRVKSIKNRSIIPYEFFFLKRKVNCSHKVAAVEFICGESRAEWLCSWLPEKMLILFCVCFYEETPTQPTLICRIYCSGFGNKTFRRTVAPHLCCCFPALFLSTPACVKSLFSWFDNAT